MASAINDIRREVEPVSTAIARALEDVAAVCDEPAVAWLDLRTSHEVTVLVVSQGAVHYLRGPRPPDQEEPKESSCEYTVFPIRSDWKFEFSLTHRGGVQTADGSTGNWVFSFGNESPRDKLEIEVSSSRESDEDATNFARALAREIVHAQTIAEGAESSETEGDA